MLNRLLKYIVIPACIDLESEEYVCDLLKLYKTLKACKNECL